MSPWEKLLERPEPYGHLIQLYGDEDLSAPRSASRYLMNGLRNRDGLLVIADDPNGKAIRRQLELDGMDVEAAIRDNQISFAGARDTLSLFMRDGQPDWKLFESALGTAMGHVRSKLVGSGLRIYSDIAGILWNSGQFAAANRVEQFLNKFLGRSSFSLFCGYGIDIFGKDFNIAHVDALLCAHTHLLPGVDGQLEPALSLAMDQILGSKAQDLKSLIKANFHPSWAVIPSGEATVLWLRNNLPEHADRIISRARELCRTMRQTRRAA